MYWRKKIAKNVTIKFAEIMATVQSVNDSMISINCNLMILYYWMSVNTLHYDYTVGLYDLQQCKITLFK